MRHSLDGCQISDRNLSRLDAPPEVQPVVERLGRPSNSRRRPALCRSPGQTTGDGDGSGGGGDFDGARSWQREAR